MKPVVQLSLDLTSVEEALRLAEIGVRAGVDWLEAGTPLILAEGLRAVQALHERFPDHPIVADLKTMDGGYLEAEMMAKAGASMVVVMGVAHPATIRAVVRAARDYGIKTMGDIMAAPDKVACAKMLEENGVDYIIVHTGFDERHEITGLSPLDDLPAITAAVNIPVQAVGGLTIEQIMRLPEMEAPLVVIGAPLAISDRAFEAGGPDEQLEAVLRQVVEVVHGGRRAAAH
jgi:3-hexulose-6-phosphate synthase/6-phospho-3-hexuloisomerase